MPETLISLNRQLVQAIIGAQAADPRPQDAAEAKRGGHRLNGFDGMKVAILAGGLGTRLAEETATKSKAMVEIGGRPILWHVMRYYASAGLREFVVALGYKGDTIRGYFAADGFRRVAVDGDTTLPEPTDERQRWKDDEWTVDLVETGVETQNGGRIKRLARYLDDGTFMLTWCDGLSNVDLHRLLAFHRAHGRLATLTAVHPPPRFGRLRLDGERVVEFQEKTVAEDEWVNGAFFVLEPGVMEYIDGDDTSWEHHSLARLARDGQLMAYRHESYWQCMDTLREAQALNSLWNTGKAPWKVWD